MRDLEHILRSETENLQDLTDSAVTQTATTVRTKGVARRVTSVDIGASLDEEWGRASGARAAPLSRERAEPEQRERQQHDAEIVGRRNATAVATNSHRAALDPFPTTPVFRWYFAISFSLPYSPLGLTISLIFSATAYKY